VNPNNIIKNWAVLPLCNTQGSLVDPDPKNICAQVFATCSGAAIIINPLKHFPLLGMSYMMSKSIKDSDGKHMECNNQCG